MSLAHAVEELHLDNGARGIVVTIPNVHSVYMTFALRAGAQYVPDELCQVPHLIEHMAFTHPGEFENQEAFSRAFTKRSASEDASTDEVHVTYEASCSLSEYERIVGLMGEVVANPTFTSDNFDVEKSTVLEELTADLNRDTRVFWQMANRLSGGGGRTDQEKIDSLAATTVEHVREFYARSHVSDNLRFVIAGDVTPDAVRELLAAWPLSRGTRPELRQDVLHTLAEPVVLARPEYGTLDFSLSLCASGLLSHEEDIAWGFVNHLLFQTYHSRVFGALRSKGVCYDIGAVHMNMMHNYRELEVYGSVSSEHIEHTLRHTIGELRALADGQLTAEEVGAVRDYILGYQERRFESPGEVAGFYESQYLASESVVTDSVLLDIVKRMDVDTIVSYARQWLTERTARFGLIGNVEAVDLDQLQAIVNTIGKR